MVSTTHIDESVSNIKWLFVPITRREFTVMETSFIESKRITVQFYGLKRVCFDLRKTYKTAYTPKQSIISNLKLDISLLMPCSEGPDRGRVWTLWVYLRTDLPKDSHDFLFLPAITLLLVPPPTLPKFGSCHGHLYQHDKTVIVPISAPGLK